MENNVEKTDAQLIKYFEKVIVNAATNHYKKKKMIEEKEITGVLLEELLIQKEIEVMFPTLTILNVPLFIEDEQIEQILKSLKKKEKVFLIEKFFLDKTDKEIGEILGISRSGVTNLKLRLYNKFQL